VPQVASDPTIHAHSSTTPRQARPAQQPDRADSPFETCSTTVRRVRRHRSNDHCVSPPRARARESRTASADRAPPRATIGPDCTGSYRRR